MGEGMDVPTHPLDMETPSAERPSYARPQKPRKPVRSFPMGTALVALAVVLVSIGALFAFSGATVSVTAMKNPTSVSGDFLATLSGGELPFEVLTVEKVASASVASEGTETVNQSAQGTIVITNTQDVAQQLIKNTRFETPDGLIFRVRDSITVPKAANGTPGSLETTVYADATGENYNVSPTTFTLPGLKGGAIFTQVTASSKEAMKGGFAGPRPSVSAATREKKAGELRAKLEADIKTALTDAIPEGYVLVQGASRVTYEPQPDAAVAGNNVEIAEKAVATAVVFPSAALAKAVAYQVVGSYTGQNVLLGDSKGLTLASVEDLPVPGTTEFAFALTGNAVIDWQIDASKIAAAVAGKSRSSAQTVLSGFPEVDRAALVLRPFWSSSFPADPTKIKVSVENGQEAK